MKKLILFVFSTVLFLTTAAFADSIICEKDVVNSGDTTAVVEYNCGKPIEKNATGAVERKRGYKHGVNEVEKATETWTYIIDERFRYFEFVGGKLVSIKDGPIAR